MATRTSLDQQDASTSVASAERATTRLKIMRLERAEAIGERARARPSRDDGAVQRLVRRIAALIAALTER